MAPFIREEAKDDLFSRGYSRRQMMRAAMMVGGAGAAAFGFGPEFAFAQERSPAKIQIGLNECWAPPFAPGLKAAAAVSSQSNRYAPHNEQGALVAAISQVENIPADHVSTWPGSNPALARSVLAFCSPTKGLVLADPSYETPQRAAAWLGAPMKKVPLKADYSHDVKAMLAANPNAGLYYVCSPNNPTGTLTPMADIEWLVDNKPAGAVVVIDEAYIHWTPGFPGNTATHLARAGKDVLVMRTFSKVFGMAGMRIGFVMARPDIIQKLQMYDDGFLSFQLPAPSAACAAVSIAQADLIARRRQELIATRTMVEEMLTKRKLKIIGPSQANMLMIDWKTKTSKDMQAAFRAQDVEIARAFPAWPTVSRITIGSKSDMEGFFVALDRIGSA
jgi:histidinol-phosphate aminotransferase